jgi:ferredoxin
MAKLSINNRQVEARPGATILETARSLGIEIPTLCHLNGSEPFGSCMLCLVKDEASGRLLPACSAPAVAGMAVRTESAEVRVARKDVLDLLLREHTGDCRAPCELGCPARADIPSAIRALEAGDARRAIRTIGRSIAFPDLVCGACPAPCESACRRGRHDEPVSIRALMLTAARTGSPVRPNPRTGKTVAVIGGGIAGLCAAYYLGLEGHACTLYLEDNPPGMREGPPGDMPVGFEPPVPGSLKPASPESVLGSLGVEFRSKNDAEIDISKGGAAEGFDAVVVASGSDGKTTSRKKTAVVSAADGREAARAVHRYLSDPRRAERRGATFLFGEEIDERRNEFDSRLGALLDGELEVFLNEAAPYPRVVPSVGEGLGGEAPVRGDKNPVGEIPSGKDLQFDENEAVREAGRCLRCDCAKKNTCALRRYAARYGARGKRPADPQRKRFERMDGGYLAGARLRVHYEPGKCIKCGICVRITESRGENPGLAFLGRGYGVRVGVPFGDPLSSALAETAEECARSCPTGALALIPVRSFDLGTDGV